MIICMYYFLSSFNICTFQANPTSRCFAILPYFQPFPLNTWFNWFDTSFLFKSIVPKSVSLSLITVLMNKPLFFQERLVHINVFSQFFL